MRRASMAGLPLLLLCSCATLFSGSRRNFEINSQPEGAGVYLDGRRIGTTPVVVEAQASRDTYFELRLEGHESRCIGTQQHVGAGWVALDVWAVTTILFAWVIVVDAATGNWFELSGLNVELQTSPPTPKDVPNWPLTVGTCDAKEGRVPSASSTRGTRRP